MLLLLLFRPGSAACAENIERSRRDSSSRPGLATLIPNHLLEGKPRGNLTRKSRVFAFCGLK
jgi:hypothetical protein